MVNGKVHCQDYYCVVPKFVLNIYFCLFFIPFTKIKTFFFFNSFKNDKAAAQSSNSSSKSNSPLLRRTYSEQLVDEVRCRETCVLT